MLPSSVLTYSGTQVAAYSGHDTAASHQRMRGAPSTTRSQRTQVEARARGYRACA
jgi:hypothetical protein